MDGCGFPARPQNSRSLFASINRKRFKFRSKDKPCDSTCSGVELSLLVDSSSSRLGIFLRERDATITKKPGRRLLALRGTKRFLGWSKVHFPQGTEQVQSKKTLFTRPLWKKTKLLVGSGIANGTFHWGTQDDKKKLSLVPGLDKLSPILVEDKMATNSA